MVYMLQRHFRAGFTLLETVLVIAVSSAVVLAVFVALNTVLRGQKYAFESADALKQTRLSLGQMVRDIREAAYSDVGDYPLVAIASSSITFYSDVDRDEKIERVRYFLDGDRLVRGELEATGSPPAYHEADEKISVRAHHIRNSALGVPLLNYYDVYGNTLADLSRVTDVAFVTVRVIINLNPNRAPEDYELRSSAALRNRPRL